MVGWFRYEWVYAMDMLIPMHTQRTLCFLLCWFGSNALVCFLITSKGLSADYYYITVIRGLVVTCSGEHFSGPCNIYTSLLP